MAIPRAREAAPALVVAVAVHGVVAALFTLGFGALRAGLVGHHPLFGVDPQAWLLLSLAAGAAAVATTTVAAAAALGLARGRRSPGAALTAAGFAVGALAATLVLVATWLWDERWQQAARGWRYDVRAAAGWVDLGVALATTLGLCAAGWRERAVRLIAPAALGAALLAKAPPPLTTWAYQVIEGDTWQWRDGQYHQVISARLWIVPAVTAAGAAAWGVAMALLAHLQRRLPDDAVAPRPAPRPLRGLAVALVVIAGVAVAAGLTIAVVQGRSVGDTGPLGLLIPVVVGVAAAVVGVMLLRLAVADVSPAASRRFAVAAVLVLWCVAVVAAQTLWSQRPRPSARPFVVFEAPWIPGMVGAAVVVAALLCITAGLGQVAAQAGARPGRVHGAVVVSALVLGAATTPWVLGFGIRSLPLDGLRLATLASAAVVNLAASVALARSAWRVAAALSARREAT